MQGAGLTDNRRISNTPTYTDIHIDIHMPVGWSQRIGDDSTPLDSDGTTQVRHQKL